MRKANLIQTAIWLDDDFLRLSSHARFLYVLLLTQPNVSCPGHMTIAPGRWAAMLGITQRQVEASLRALDEAGFIWLDEDACEVAIRSWVKHNISGSKLEAAARDQFPSVASPHIRIALQAEYPDLFSDAEGAPGIRRARAKRNGIPNATRFRILKRDGYACRYCGRRPPAVTLEVDHAESAVDGGSNVDVNLVTACVDCNNGKGRESVPVDAIPNTPSRNQEYPIRENDSGTRLAGRGKRVEVSGSSEIEQARARADHVWAEYQQRHPRSVFTPARRRTLTRWLDTYEADMLIGAIVGNHLDPHCNGQNDTGTQYHDFELIFRDEKHIERYAGIARNGAPVPHSRSAAGRTLALARQAAQEGH
jgi:hypothetical protein